MTPFDLVHLNLALDLIRPGQTSLVLVGSWLVPAKSADVSQTVEDSEHSETQTRDPQHTGAQDGAENAQNEADQEALYPRPPGQRRRLIGSLQYPGPVSASFILNAQHVL